MITEKKQDILIQKLDHFIRRYYKNMLIKGVLYTLFVIFSFFIIANTLEFFGYFSQLGRASLFWSFLSVAIILIIKYIFLSLLKLFRLGTCISHEDAAIIIGGYFPEVRDKLLNVIQLKNSITDHDSELLQASIQQKTDLLRPIPFIKAIDVKKNRVYLRYALIPIVALIALLVLYPSFITESSKRILHYSTHFVKPAPFTFVLQSSPLQVEQQGDFEVQIKVEGKSLPNEVEIVMEGVRAKMKKTDKLHFSYTIKNVNRSLNFFFEAVEVRSDAYTLTVLPRPVIISFEVKVTPPNYTKKPSEIYQNIGDLTLLRGSVVEWVFDTKDASTLSFWFDNQVETYKTDSTKPLLIRKKLTKDVSYGFCVGNQHIFSSDSMLFSIQLIEDARPSISVIEFRDSLMPEILFFRGSIGDDYGFSKLQFHIIKKSSSQSRTEGTTLFTIPVAANETSSEFSYSFELADIHFEEGDQLEYYFEVWDNDAVLGPKSSTSQHYSLKIYTKEEVNQISQKNSEQVKEETDRSIAELKRIQAEVREMLKKIVQKKEINWQDKKQMQDLLSREQEIKRSLEQIQERIKQNRMLEEHYKKQDESILEKQKELEKLFEKMMSEEMKDLMKDIEQLLNQNNKDAMKEALDKMQHTNESIEKQLDRNIELFKRMEIEKALEQLIDKSSKLAQEQRKLAEQTKNAKKEDLDALEYKQQKLKEEFEELKKGLDEIEKKNAELQEPQSMKRDKNLENDIQKKQNEASSQLKNKKQDKAAEKQNEAAESLEQLSEQMEDMQMEMEMEESAEDVDRIRILLKNLLKLSFEQEELITQINKVYIQDPKYQTIINRQNKLKDDFKMIEDTLLAIGKRQIKVSSLIDKELGAVNTNISLTLENLLRFNQVHYGAMRNSNSATNMQYTMTSLNNLALVLNESLEQMQQNLRSKSQKQNQKKKPSNASCDNPNSDGNGKKKKKSVSMREMQEQMNERLKQMKEALEKQAKEGKPRKVGEGSKMNEELARMAAQQEQIRRMMQEYAEQLKNESGGKRNPNLDGLIKEMEQNEKDIVNKTINQQTLMRQEQIVTRLLEHEKADMKREKEEQRESKEAKEIQGNRIADSLYQKKRQQIGEKEIIKYDLPTYAPFYRKKINDYFNQQ